MNLRQVLASRNSLSDCLELPAKNTALLHLPVNSRLPTLPEKEDTVLSVTKSKFRIGDKAKVVGMSPERFETPPRGLCKLLFVRRSNSRRTAGRDQIFCFVFSAMLSVKPAASAASLSLRPTSFSRMNVRSWRERPFSSFNRRAAAASDLVSPASRCSIAVLSEASVRLDIRLFHCPAHCFSGALVRPSSSRTRGRPRSESDSFSGSFREG